MTEYGTRQLLLLRKRLLKLTKDTARLRDTLSPEDDRFYGQLLSDISYQSAIMYGHVAAKAEGLDWPSRGKDYHKK